MVKSNDAFVKELRKAMADKGVLHQKDVAKLILIDPSTFSKKMQNPDDFKLGEIRQLAKCLDFSDEAKQKII